MSVAVREFLITKPFENVETLPRLDNHQNLRELHLHFNENYFINSMGLVHWLRWMKPVADNRNASIYLHKCSSMVIHLLNVVSPSMPPNLKVRSFFIPYFSDQTEESRHILCYTAEIKNEKPLKLPEIFDSKGNLMGLNVIEDQYFQFLNKHC